MVQLPCARSLEGLIRWNADKCKADCNLGERQRQYQDRGGHVHFNGSRENQDICMVLRRWCTNVRADCSDNHVSRFLMSFCAFA